jgi:two-component system, chemotaxis family, chemotaxis protein CheY
VKRHEMDGRKRKGRSVLIVDDNPLIRRVVSQALRSDGFAICAEADDGRQAIDLAKQLIPDLIILDLSMPVMNGLEAASELRQITPKAPIILLTMFGDELVADEAAKIGVDLVVSKTEALSSVLDKAHSLAGSCSIGIRHLDSQQEQGSDEPDGHARHAN